MSLSKYAITAGYRYLRRSHRTRDMVRYVVEITAGPKSRVVWQEVDVTNGQPYGPVSTSLLESFASWAHEELTCVESEKI